MVCPSMLHSPATTLATMNHVSNATILAIFVSIASGMSAPYAKSTVPATPNAVAHWVVLTLAPRRPHPHPLLNLVPSLLLIPDEWSQRTLAFAVATHALVLPPVLVLPLKTLITTMLPSPT